VGSRERFNNSTDKRSHYDFGNTNSRLRTSPL